MAAAAEMTAAVEEAVEVTTTAAPEAAMTAVGAEGAGATITAALEAETTAVGAAGAAGMIAPAVGAAMTAPATGAAMPGVDAAVGEMTARAVAAMITDAIRAGPTTALGQELRISTRPAPARAVQTISPSCAGCGDEARMMQVFRTTTEDASIETSASSPEMIAGSMADK